MNTKNIQFAPIDVSAPRFVRIGDAEVALAKITKIQVHHFGFNEFENGRKYVSSGSIIIHILNREEALYEFGDRGYELLQFFLDLYGISDPSTEYHEGTIYP